MRGADPSGSGAGQPDQALAQDLTYLLQRRVEPTGPGAVLAVYRDGSLLASTASGLADLEQDAPLTATTPIEIASVSKQISAATILALARDGLVDLDADLRALVPEVRLEGITLRHCLHHTSGLPDFLTVAEILGVPIGAAIGYDAFLADLARTTERHFPAGTDISYSNTGYVVAAIAAERAAGTTFPELVAERVFGPLGMSSSVVRTYTGEVTPGMAWSYEPHPPDAYARVEMGENDAVVGARQAIGDGEILTTITDFAAWHGFLLDGRVLGTDLRDELLRRSLLADGRVTSYGMGLMHSCVGDLEMFGHSGSIWGYRAQSLTHPGSRTGVAVFANRSDLDVGDLALRALRSATDPVRVSGLWYSPEAVRDLRVTVRGDGGVDVETDGESEVLDRVRASTWAGASPPEGLELDGDSVVHTDGMGRRIRYVRVEQGLPAPSPDSVTGTYRVAERPDDVLVVRAGGDHGLELVRGSLDPVPLEYVTTHGRVDVYRVEGALLTVHHADGAPHITISAGSAVLRDLPRTS